MTQLAGLILAAGVSSRMGAFKPMLPVDGQTMIRRVADMMRRAGADPILVVTGYRGEVLERHLEGLNIRFIRNERYYSTQMLDSLVLGLERLEGETRRVLVSPADIPLVEAGRVFIFGGGHVAQALVPALAAVDFRCAVLEDRADFCLRELFPGAEEVRHIDMARALEEVPITSEDYVVIMTRGHRDDLLLQEQVLRTPARYIGVIGSRRKKAALFAQLRERGFTDADLERITTPIGLSIGAETPAEIAVSIAAQLIQVRASQ